VPFLYDPAARNGEGALLAVADVWLARAVRADAASRRRGRIVWQRE
jgi:hypothetical protein